MRGVILAAGVGSRLRPMTDAVPKALVEVGGRPILDYQLEALRTAGIRDIIICSGYRADLIRQACRTRYPDLEVRFVENQAYASTNNMFSLYLAREHLEGDLIVMNGDVCFGPEVIHRLRVVEGSAVAVDPRVYSDESMKIVVDTYVRDISKTIGEAAAFGCSIDVYKFIRPDVERIRQALVELIETGEAHKEWFEVLLQRLFRSGELRATPCEVDSPWVEVDDSRDLNTAEKLFNPRFSALSERSVFFFDRDGTLTVGERLIDGAAQILSALQRRGTPFYVLTNNSSRTPEEHATRLSGLPVTADRVVVSTDAAISYLRQSDISRAHLCATATVKQYFADRGVTHTTLDPQAAVLTYNNEITYQDIRYLVELVAAGIPYYATHGDILYPYEKGFLPDAGSFIAMIETATGRRPDRTFGKPDPAIIDVVLERIGLLRSDAVVVGDRLYTDMALAHGTDLASVLVLSGETRREDLANSAFKPDVVIDSVADLIPLFEG